MFKFGMATVYSNHRIALANEGMKENVSGQLKEIGTLPYMYIVFMLPT
jgi:hypothetical protein